VTTCHPSDASAGGWPRAARATNVARTTGAAGAALRAPAAGLAAVQPWDAAVEDHRASTMKPPGAPLGAHPREASRASSSAGAFPSRRTKGGDTSTKHDGGLELEPTALTPEHSPRQTTSAKEVVGEALEGRPDLPSEEDGLKRSHSGSSSAAVSAKRDGEKGEAASFREEQGTGHRRSGAGHRQGCHGVIELFL
jgi:hypothetical protein